MKKTLITLALLATSSSAFATVGNSSSSEFTATAVVDQTCVISDVPTNATVYFTDETVTDSAITITSNSSAIPKISVSEVDATSLTRIDGADSVVSVNSDITGKDILDSTATEIAGTVSSTGSYSVNLNMTANGHESEFRSGSVEASTMITIDCGTASF